MSERVCRKNRKHSKITEKLYKDFERREHVRTEIENFKIDQ